MTRYELLDRIGVGGMAEIFRGKAVAAGGFEKPVAIKRILPHLSQDRRFVELLIAEAKVLSLLKHRNIVQIFDVGVGDDGKYFLVMEYVDGKDIGAVQRALENRRRRMPFDSALHIGAEICEALEHAHVARAPDGKAMSLVHRDVSPSNVLLSRAGEVKLTDFGIAKRAEQDPTNGGAVRGKFAYISPEQARNEHLDPRSDVFSVGILMWEMICNRRLFSHLDDLAALRGVREGQIQRPTEVDPRLPPDIDQVLMTALSRDKSRRFPTAGQFGQKLRALRYALEVTVGDPATELAKIVESTEEVERQSKSQMKPGATRNFDFDASEEGTVIRIKTADAFSARDEGASINLARKVIDRFEEEETRLASLSGDQIRMLRDAGPINRDSNEMTALAAPLQLDDSLAPRQAPMSLDDDSTQAREPISDDLPMRMPQPGDTPLPPDEATRLVAPRDRRTPAPQRIPNTSRRHQTQQPPPLAPMRPRGPTPAPPISSQPQMAPPPSQPQQPAYGAPIHQQQVHQQQVHQQQVHHPQVHHPQAHHPQAHQPPITPPIITAPPQHGFGTPLHAPPMQQQPMQQQPMQQAPYGAPQFGGWTPPAAGQRPSMQDMYQETPPQQQQRPSMQRMPRRAKRGLQPWMLVVGALVMAALAFAITRMFIR